MPPPLKRNPAFEALVAQAKKDTELRKRVKARIELRKCETCKESFKATRTWQVYCCTSCQRAGQSLKALDERRSLLDRLLELEAERDDLMLQVEALQAEITSYRSA
jgi:hypothetical protein